MSGRPSRIRFLCHTCQYSAVSADPIMLATLVQFHQEETGHTMEQKTKNLSSRSESLNSDVLAHLKELQVRDMVIYKKLLNAKQGDDTEAKTLRRCLKDRQKEIDRLIESRKRRAQPDPPRRNNEVPQTAASLLAAASAHADRAGRPNGASLHLRGTPKRSRRN